MRSVFVHRPILTTLAPLLAAVAFGSFSQGRTASAGPFNLEVNDWFQYVPSDQGRSAAIVAFSADLGLGPYDWQLDSIYETSVPRNRNGETIYGSPNPIYGWDWAPGSRIDERILLVYWVWPDSPRGVFSGGEVTLKAYRDEFVNGYWNRIEESETVGFSITIPGDPSAVPEPASAISAGVASLAGVVMARRRKLRRAA